MLNLAIWDLDNCLADDAWRIPFVDWHAASVRERYARYHELCIRDRPGNTEEFRRSVAAAEPLFITGRPDSVRCKTIHWIAQHLGVDWPRLLMRGDTDHRPSVNVKMEALVAELSRLGGAHIIRAYDDREDIVQMYHDTFDIDARLLGIHSVDAYARPREVA